MDEARKEQIALLYLKRMIREESMGLTSDMKLQFGNISKAIGISIEEATEFSEIMVRELVEEISCKPKLKMSNILEKSKLRDYRSEIAQKKECRKEITRKRNLEKNNSHF